MRNPLQKLSVESGALLAAPADNWAVQFPLLLMQGLPLVASGLQRRRGWSGSEGLSSISLDLAGLGGLCFLVWLETNHKDRSQDTVGHKIQWALITGSC